MAASSNTRNSPILNEADCTFLINKVYVKNLEPKIIAIREESPVIIGQLPSDMRIVAFAFRGDKSTISQYDKIYQDAKLKIETYPDNIPWIKKQLDMIMQTIVEIKDGTFIKPEEKSYGGGI
jgi:hypothetical protein